MIWEAIEDRSITIIVTINLDQTQDSEHFAHEWNLTKIAATNSLQRCLDKKKKTIAY